MNPNKQRWCLWKKRIVGSKGSRLKNKSGWGGQEKEAFLSFFKRRLLLSFFSFFLSFFLSFVRSFFLPSFLPSFSFQICFFDPYLFFWSLSLATRHPKSLIRGRLKTPADHSTGGLLSTRITPHQIQQMLLHAATLQYMSCKCHEITKWSWMCCCSAICQFVSPDFIIFATGMPNELCSIHGPNPRAPCFGHWQTHAAEP